MIQGKIFILFLFLFFFLRFLNVDRIKHFYFPFKKCNSTILAFNREWLLSILKVTHDIMDVFLKFLT